VTLRLRSATFEERERPPRAGRFLRQRWWRPPDLRTHLGQWIRVDTPRCQATVKASVYTWPRCSRRLRSAPLLNRAPHDRARPPEDIARHPQAMLNRGLRRHTRSSRIGLPEAAPHLRDRRALSRESARPEVQRVVRRARLSDARRATEARYLIAEPGWHWRSAVSTAWHVRKECRSTARITSTRTATKQRAFRDVDAAGETGLAPSITSFGDRRTQGY